MENDQLVESLILKEKRLRKGVLDIGNCGLDSLPDSLFELTWLEELKVSNKVWDFVKREWKKGENSGDPNFLVSNSLDSRLKKLTSLKKLYYGGDFSQRWGLENISTISELDNLSHIYLGFNRIKNIRPLRHLKEIEYLDLRSNQVWEYNFGYLPKLKTLSLNSNRISRIADLANVKSLAHLDIGSNQIFDFRTIESLVGLVFLDASMCQLRTTMPLKKLRALEFLNLSINKLNDLDDLEGLTNIAELHLRNNEIADISTLSNLVKLEHLYLDFNNITLLRPLSQLRKLRILTLKQNKIFSVNPLKDLHDIVELDLENNNIKSIDPLKEVIKKGINVSFESGLEGIILKGNPITTPPYEIVSLGAKEILKWYLQISKHGKEPFFEARTLILGQGGAGKTSLANLLIDPKYVVKPEIGMATLGVVIQKNKQYQHKLREGVTVKTHLWDFGGQDIQKMLHQFFISSNSLFILVSDKRSENTNFHYWFQIINLLGSGSCVIVVENEKNIESTNLNFPLTTFRELYGSLKIVSVDINLLKTNSHDKERWRFLNSVIQGELSEMEIVNRPVPKSWIPLRRLLSEHNGGNFITKDQYYDFALNLPIPVTKTEADQCLNYLHQIGDVVHFEDNILESFIFLNHNWLIHGMYYILADKSIVRAKGHFTREQAYETLEQYGYSEMEKSLLLQLLLKDKFDICYPLTGGDQEFITPILLPDDKPEKWGINASIKFRYEYGFIPNGMFSRLIVRLHKKIDGELRWKSGMRLIEEIDRRISRAEVHEFIDPDDSNHIIEISISGAKSDNKELLRQIRNEVEYLNNEFKNLRVKRFVACNCSFCKRLLKEGDKPTYFNYEVLMENIQDGDYLIKCRKGNRKRVNIGSLLNDIVIEDLAIDNSDKLLLEMLKEMNISMNNISVNQDNTQTVKQEQNNVQSTEVNVSIEVEINSIISEAENLIQDIIDEKDILKEKVDEREIELVIKDIQKAQNEIKKSEFEESPNRGNRLLRLIKNLPRKDTRVYKVLKNLQDGAQYALGIADSYNRIAANIGWPMIPPLVIDSIKSLYGTQKKD